MAGIYKLYVHKSEYPEYRKFYSDNCEQMIQDLGYPIQLYPFEYLYNALKEEGLSFPTKEFLKRNTDDLEIVEESDSEYVTIWNTSTEADKWLYKHCKIQSFIDRLKEQHDEDFDEVFLKQTDMTDIEKFIKLFSIACNNGYRNSNDWESYGRELHELRLTNGNKYEDYTGESLNDIVGDWERGKISFLQALLIADGDEFNDNGHELSFFIRSEWFNRPSSKRLEYLFEAFKQLIEA